MKTFDDDNTLDDLALARLVAGGPPERAEPALGILYNRYADPLFAFIYHHLGERSAAEDVWQDTWLAALRGMAAYRGQSQLFTWLCGIARHKIADHCRRQGRQGVHVTETPLEMLNIANGPIPEETLARLDVRLRTVKSLAALPEDYRTALVARYADECSVDEVARRLGKPYKAAESLLSRAKAAFRSAFAQMEPKDE